MEPYYTAYPWERPLTPEQVAADRKRVAEWEKAEARRARRRTGPAERERKIDWDAEGQKDVARASGAKNADKVNLQPFLKGNVDRTKVGG